MTQLNKIVLSFIFLLIIPLTDAFAQVDKAAQENIIMSAVSRYDNKDFDGAIKLLKSVVEQDSESDAAYYYLALSYFSKEDPELAEAYLRRAHELDPENFWYRHRLAVLYTATKRPELAIDIYESLLKDFPKKSDLYFEVVELYTAREDFEKALQTLDEIETVFGKTESTAVYRFNLLRRMNRAEEQEGDDASAQALCAEQNGIPPPKDSPLADTDKKHTCGKHQKQDGRTKGRKEPG